MKGMRAIFFNEFKNANTCIFDEVKQYKYNCTILMTCN